MRCAKKGARIEVTSPALDGITDLPKSMVDGYAVQAKDVRSQRPVRFQVLEEITAGLVPSKEVQSGTATRIMTGAPIPDGADAVVMVERTSREISAGVEYVDVSPIELRAGANIMPRATSLRRGDMVLRRGHQIRPIEVGLLAEVGRTQVQVTSSPSVAVLATGDELVTAEIVPRPGQIRNSNGPMVNALVQTAGGTPFDLGVAPDDEQSLATLIAQGLESDILVLSGGVSAGILDLVPACLEAAGVKQVFHNVALKPGKPLWFGIRAGDRPKIVFGLPGNPVSTLVCFHLFVRPAIRGMAGIPLLKPQPHHAKLASEHTQRGQRPTYFPARTLNLDGATWVETVGWQGSADLRSVAEADALICFPAGDRCFRKGETVEVHFL